jgi:hypothetical protein
MKEKPNLLIFQDLIEPIDKAINELTEILESYQSEEPRPDYIDKGIFAYVVALFEGSISECVERYLFSFPDKLPKGKVDFDKYRTEMLSADFSYEINAILIQDYLTECSYESGENLVKKYCDILGIDSLSELFNKKLNEKKARRNALVHSNLKVDSKYIRTARSDPRDKGKYLRIRPAYVVETVLDIIEILQRLRSELETKYGSYSILNAVKEVWAYLFKSEIMKFDDYWGVSGDMLYIKSENIKKYYKSLSSGERSTLFYLLQNYAPGVCEKIFKSRDFNMQVSNNQRMVFLVSVFDRYPLLLQNLNCIQPAKFFKYVQE